MNKDNAREYLPLVQALAEGKTIQISLDGSRWQDTLDASFNHDASMYRIKPEPVKGWYRVAMLGSGESARIELAESSGQSEAQLVSRIDFIRWLTNRIEYEV